MRRVICWTAAVALVAAANASGQAAVAPAPLVTLPMPQRFQSALTFRQFTAGDSARRDEWTRNYADAAAPVADVRSRVRAIPRQWHLLIVAESWCRDAVNSVPYLARLAAENPNIDVRLLRSADARDLLDAHPLEGRSATPLVLIFDEHFVERGAWIERPTPLRALTKSKEGRVCEDALREEVAKWRAADAGASVLAEVLSFIDGQVAATHAGPTKPR